MAQNSQKGNGGNGHLPIEDRIGRLEIAVERVVTQLESSIDHITTTLEQMAKRIDGGKPNWVGIIAICLAFAGLIGTLFTVSTDGKIAPVKGDVAHLEQIMATQINGRNREIEIRETARDREIELREEINALTHGQMAQRLDKIETRLSTRYSDNDDAQNEQMRAIQREVDLIRQKNP